MRNSVEIINLYKKIYYQKTRSKQFGNKFIPICASLIVAFLLVFSFGTSDLKSIGGSMGLIYNPVNSLYNDNSSIVFTGYLLNEKNLDFIIPIKGVKLVENDEGNLSFEVGSSIMVYATESGVVEKTGKTLDGVKYIKIRHTPIIVSIIENVDIIGVDNGVIVKKGQDIATAKADSVVTFKLFKNDEQIKNITINQSKIVWQE